MELIDHSNHVVAGNLVYVMCSYCEDIILTVVVVQVTLVRTFHFGGRKKKTESTVPPAILEQRTKNGTFNSATFSTALCVHSCSQTSHSNCNHVMLPTFRSILDT